MSELEYCIKFPVTEASFSNNELTFSINHIKSRDVSSVYFILTTYNMDSELLYTYTSERWLIDSVYMHKETTFTIPSDVADNSSYYQLELRGVGLSSENPLYFNEVMLQEGEFSDYHTPQEIVNDWEIKFNRNSYANLYGKDGMYLQVIRPQRDSFLTNRLTKSNCTVLSPHLYDESSVDNPVTVFLEFINQTEQRIDVLR